MRTSDDKEDSAQLMNEQMDAKVGALKENSQQARKSGGCKGAKAAKQAGSGRAKRSTAKDVQYCEASARSHDADATCKVVQEEECKSEAVALEQTAAPGEGTAGGCKRRLRKFAVVTSDGEPVSMQRIGLQNCEDCFIEGAVYPSTGALNKANGRAVAKAFGPMQRWSATYDGKAPAILLTTAAATYTCATPAPEYRALFTDAQEQVALCHALVQALRGKEGAQLGFEGALAALNRAKAVKGYVSVRDAVLLNGAFVLGQLPAMQAAVGKALDLSACKFVSELRAELKCGAPRTLKDHDTASISIREPGSREAAEHAAAQAAAAGAGAAPMDVDTAEAADAEYARRMQAKLDAAEHAARQRGGVKQAKGQAYIKISEEEIADDYPMPAQYELQEEELDEFVVNGDDDVLLDVDPECLPKMIIDDFAAYNGEGFMSTLELLPMWQDVDPDVDLFASGVISELSADASEWAAGHALSLDGPSAQELDAEATMQCAGSGAGASSSAAAAAGPAGVRVSLSQIKEWHVELACDMLFIVVRTDCAWYKIRTVHEAYGGWFEPILKVARVAVRLLGMIQDEARSSRVSFADLAKRLAAEPPAAPTHISTKLPAVQRFLVVHGQIILNQFWHYPVREVQRCAFITGLKERMEARRHSKLFLSARRITARGGAKVNPMRGRAPAPKPKPMTATATNLVKEVWLDYFKNGASDNGEEGKGVKEVEEDENAEDDADVADDAAEAQEDALTATAKSPSRAATGRTRRGAAGKPRNTAGDVSDEIKDAAEADLPRAGARLFRAATAGAVAFALGDVVELEDDEEDSDGEEEAAQPLLGLVQAIFRGGEAGAEPEVQVRVMVHGEATVLGDAASAYELFVTDALYECPLGAVRAKCRAAHLRAPAGHGAARDEAIAAVRVLLEGNEAAAAAGEPIQMLYRMLYLPEEGMFRLLPGDLRQGAYLHEKEDRDGMVDGGKGVFMYEGQQYRVGDFVYLLAKAPSKASGDASSEDDEAEAEAEPKAAPKAAKKAPAKARGKRKRGAARGDSDDEDDEDFVVAKKAAEATGGASKPAARKAGRSAKRVAAPRGGGSNDENEGDVVAAGGGDEKADGDAEAAAAKMKPWMEKYKRHDLKHGKGDLGGLTPYTVAQILSVAASKKGARGTEKVQGIKVRTFARPEAVSAEHAYATDPWTVYATASEETVKLDALRGRCVVSLDDAVLSGPMEMTRQQADVFICKGTLRGGAVEARPEGLAVKGAPAEQPPVAPASDAPASGADDMSLRTLDIFSGCGGLSEGMHQARAATTKWAIEYWKPAADAFKRNNPDAAVHNGNCNVLLHRAMVKAGAEAQCAASEACREESAALDAETVDTLPLPGEVEFICGGPPCQGYSGMNRFNKGNWSMVQNSMVMAYLSYADFYRPRYWLLENVRNFVSHNKSFTFRLTVRTLLEMGYQVRFGVLNAGNFGVSQSRKRTFIWAAAPGETLPAWPQPLTVFASPQLCINLPGGISYRAVKDGKNARLRAVTVRDAIKDLPQVTNGADTAELPYGGEPVSAFQKAVRGTETTVKDHICKTMNALNLRRCELVPKNTPGADWRAIQLYCDAQKDEEDRKFNGQGLVPWCLPNTASRHNGWRGLYGRLAWDGHFPTSVTDPNPMGKVGQVFHPEQDRIVSVRECARAQGFPDRFLFSGTVQDRHKEVGNAVPPPLAAALGRMLRRELEATAARRAAQ